MLHKLKVTSYSLIILFVLILPSQAVAQVGGFPSRPGMKYSCLTKEQCAAATEAQGKQLGGAGYDFAGPYGTKGCYTYGSGKYKGMVYFGTGGTEDEMVTAPAPPKFRVLYKECWVEDGSKQPVASAPINKQEYIGGNCTEIDSGASGNKWCSGPLCSTADACADAAGAWGKKYMENRNDTIKGCYVLMHQETSAIMGDIVMWGHGTESPSSVDKPPPMMAVDFCDQSTFRWCGVYLSNVYNGSRSTCVEDRRNDATDTTKAAGGGYDIGNMMDEKLERCRRGRC